MTRPRIAGIEPSWRLVIVADRKAIPVAPASAHASAAVTGLGARAISPDATPNATLVRARKATDIVGFRAIQSEPTNEPTLNTVVMKAYVLAVPWNV